MAALTSDDLPLPAFSMARTRELEAKLAAWPLVPQGPRRAAKRTPIKDPVARARYERLRRDLVEANLRLVTKITSGVLASCDVRVSVGEVIGVGVEALTHAADCWSPTGGASFGWYACGWIRQHLNRALQRERLIRVPHDVDVETLSWPVRRAILSADLVTDEEWERCPAVVDACEAEERGKDLSLFSLAAARAARQALSARERVTLARVTNGDTLETLGRRLCVSRERARQVQVVALRKLKACLGGWE